MTAEEKGAGPVRPPVRTVAVALEGGGTLLERLLDKGVPGWGGCLIWTGRLTKGGYGAISVSGEELRVHRVAYELLVGPVPEGLHIDHTCHNRDASCPGGPGCLHRRCFHPDHLEAVTQRENTLRSPVAIAARWAARTHCDAGHPFDESNTYYRPGGGRKCMECARARARKYAEDPPPITVREKCKNGHLMTEENTRIHGRHARCRACAREQSRRRQQAARNGVPDCGHISERGNACTRPLGHDGRHFSKALLDDEEIEQ